MLSAATARALFSIIIQKNIGSINNANSRQHDSNAARAAVAEGYIKQCTGLWIVSPIQRSIDEKSAKVLLSESFKRQLKMDGGFNA